MLLKSILLLSKQGGWQDFEKEADRLDCLVVAQALHRIMHANLLQNHKAIKCCLDSTRLYRVAHPRLTPIRSSALYCPSRLRSHQRSCLHTFSQW